MTTEKELEDLAKLVRYDILLSTNAAGSGHPTSALSSVELMTVLVFGGFYRYFPEDPRHPNNDRLVFSKGHASPLLYSLWAAAGEIGEESLRTYRRFDSPLEGHPTPRFRYVDAATGSLGQGLSIGVGMALNARWLDKLPYRTFVLLGDGEMAEGSQWEALQLAAHYRLDNLIGILDVNRLGQSGETMYGHDLEAYRSRIEPFGWETIVVEDGHDVAQLRDAYRQALEGAGRPAMIIARTIKGKGVPAAENRNGFHGKALGQAELDEAIRALGPVRRSARGRIVRPRDLRPWTHPMRAAREAEPDYRVGQEVATREAFGRALTRLYPECPQIVVLDGDVCNSTGVERFQRARPGRYFQMYIAEQNMVGTALGLSVRGKIPFVTTFSAFLSRAADQIRMCQYSKANIKFCGSHGGVSVGSDGPSQMGLEDIALFRGLAGGAVLYPCDAVSMEKLTVQAARRPGPVYLRSTRAKTPVLYPWTEEFPIGKNKILHACENDSVAVVAAGVSVFEALKARESLKKDGLCVRVIDQYSVKPLDAEALALAVSPAKAVVTVEDHHLEGGLGEAVRSALAATDIAVHCLAVTRMPRSGKPAELLDFEEISADAIVRKVSEIVSGRKAGRPKGLKTRIFLDGGDPHQTRQALRLLGFLDGQTTNPTLVSKNPEVKALLAKGVKFSEDELLAYYQNIVEEISDLLPDGSVSVEVYADPSTRAEEMLRQGRRMFSWIPNAHVKFPSSKEGFRAASRAVAEGLRVNLTLCFSQEQAAAAYAATLGAAKGDVFVSPFVGRLDDHGVDGMSLVADILKTYRRGDGHVEVLTASVRNFDHFMEALHLGSDIVTAPFEVLAQWAEKGMPLPAANYRYPRPAGLRPVAEENPSLARDWRDFEVRHELTIQGEEKFSADWDSLIGRAAVPAGR